MREEELEQLETLHLAYVETGRLSRACRTLGWSYDEMRYLIRRHHQEERFGIGWIRRPRLKTAA